MEILHELINNKLFLSATLGWSMAQIIKTIINYIITREFNWERLVGSGGMPSSHSATVCALLTATIYEYGLKGFEFPMAFLFAVIVMYDAMNVRMETGKQAVILNIFLRNEQFAKVIDENGKHKLPGILKEYVGHTPTQVVAGMLLGIIIGIVICNI